MDAIDLVADLVAEYIADRCAGLSVASAHSSGSSSLKRDPFLLRECGLNRRQVAAWLALIRGTRPVHRNGRTYGGCPGLIEKIRTGPVNATDRRRFERLAFAAATGRLPRRDEVTFRHEALSPHAERPAFRHA